MVIDLIIQILIIQKYLLDPDTLEMKTQTAACGSLCIFVRGVVW